MIGTLLPKRLLSLASQPLSAAAYRRHPRRSHRQRTRRTIIIMTSLCVRIPTRRSRTPAVITPPSARSAWQPPRHCTPLLAIHAMPGWRHFSSPPTADGRCASRPTLAALLQIVPYPALAARRTSGSVLTPSVRFLAIFCASGFSHPRFGGPPSSS
ncbi:hypothetical protein N658DRAFT_80773 [Parathielavia hyrcaniae]|uniref:Uncharacterized protein n=1 Tax=Parathielavia hyrcaniae TaxID=113614 RepID=A0AAN6Q2M6_9PEZI|nr:hypothetical protein N658DRAFT_80773 [Parathielavia hyrcaniae]